MKNSHARASDPIKITNVDDIFDEQKEIRLFTANAEGYVAEGMNAGINLGLEQIGDAQFDPKAIFDMPSARIALQTISIEHAVNTLNATKKDLQRLIDKALKEGRSNQELATAISRKYGKQYKGKRALRIARTEVSAAMNAGTHIVYKAEGIERKVWISTLDPPKARESHMQVHFETHKSPVRVDDYFNVDTHKAQYPADPFLPASERINCRCTTISADFLDVMRDKRYVTLFLRQHGSLEKAFARSLRTLFEAQRHRVIDRIT